LFFENVLALAMPELWECLVVAIPVAIAVAFWVLVRVARHSESHAGAEEMSMTKRLRVLVVDSAHPRRRARLRGLRGRGGHDRVDALQRLA
jgi:hypothetical protein